MLWALLAIGWIAAFKQVRPANISQFKAACGGPAVMLAGAILLVALFLSVTLLPGKAFNFDDDLVIYFTRPMRMLQSGSIGHDPFSPLGLDSLGSHSFLQAFTLLVSGPNYLNAFDAVICFVLSLGLIAEIGNSLKLRRALVCSALATAILIHPSQVNIAASYAITGFSLAMVPAVTVLLSSPGIPVRALWRRAIPLALLLAALAGFKSTAWFFLLGTSSVLLLLVTFSRGLRMAVRTAVPVTALAFAFVLPWVALNADKYAQMAGRKSADMFWAVIGNPADLLSGAELFWGGTPRAHTAVAVFALLVCGVAAQMYLRGSKERYNPAVIPLIALCGGTVITYLLNIIPHDVTHIVRYSAPLLIAGAAGAVLLGGHLLSVPGDQEDRASMGSAGLRQLLFACAVPLAAWAMFATTLKYRVWNAIANGSVVSFHRNDQAENVRYTAWALGPEARHSIVRAQAQTAPGRQILAVVTLPHHLLFARNPIFVTSEGGLAWPWLDFPLDADATGFRHYLRLHGIRYVMWEEIGPTISPDEDIARTRYDDSPLHREMTRRSALFRKAMLALAADSKATYRDEDIVVVDVDGAN